jgi:hypothetical protein
MFILSHLEINDNMLVSYLLHDNRYYHT